MQNYLGPPPMNPLSRLLAGILAVLALAGALFFGVFILALVVGLGLIAWIVFRVRMWWIGRKLPLGATGGGAAGVHGHRTESGSGDQEGEIIDAEYTVVSRQDED